MGERTLGFGLTEQTPTLFWFLAALTMTVGNILALMQDNLKRLLAYSSVAHAGYMLVALSSAPYLGAADAPTSGVAALLFYLTAYGTMTFGIFAVMLLLHRPERPVETVDDLAGLAKSHPVIALLTTIVLLSFIGFPMTAGFAGKFFVFFGALAVQGPNAWLYPSLALLGVLNAGVGAWYYLRIIAVMYLRGTVKPIETQGTLPARAALITCAALTLILSMPPMTTWLFGEAQKTTARSVPVVRVAERQ
jgi:NADH-quinone oxidoreductase subunit N